MCSTFIKFAKTVQARLDDDSARLLHELAETDGSSVSEVMRTAIRELAQKRRNIKFYGVGVVASGNSDLGSNRNQLKNFGR